MLFASRGPSEYFSQIRHRNALTEIAWEDAVQLVQGLGMAMYTLASEKNRELLQGIVVYRQCVLQTVSSREIRNATISEFSTFLKIFKEQFLSNLRLKGKTFQFLRLSTKFLAVLRLPVNPIETLIL